MGVEVPVPVPVTVLVLVNVAVVVGWLLAVSVSVSVSIGRLSLLECDVVMEELRLGLVKVQVVWFAWVVADGISKLVPSGMLMMPVSVVIGLVLVAELLDVRVFVSSGMVEGPVGVPVWDPVAV